MSDSTLQTGDHSVAKPRTDKDYQSANEVRWCPGCGDYAILKALQKAYAELALPTENIAIVSGIGCSSRLPYYMKTYGFHTIHGRAPTVATGLKVARPDLSVWMITGDGDGLSIGLGHLFHILRRNVGVKIILFNNAVYGLTKGQASPTSPVGTVTKSSPLGSSDRPVNTALMALTAGATFYARVPDTDVSFMKDVFVAAEKHEGTALVEVFVNCVVYNDGVFDRYNQKSGRLENTVVLKHGEPLRFGNTQELGVHLSKDMTLDVKPASSDEETLVTHDKTNLRKALMLGSLSAPVPFGIFYQSNLATFEAQFRAKALASPDKYDCTYLTRLLGGEVQ